MRALDRKLFRDLWHTKGQAVAIALVVAAGIAMFVMYLSTFGSLAGTLAATFVLVPRLPLRSTVPMRARRSRYSGQRDLSWARNTSCRSVKPA